MTAKEYLNRARGIEQEIRQLQRMRRTAYERAVSCTAVPSQAPAHGGSGRDSQTDYAHYDALLDRKIHELQGVQCEIEQVIEQVENRKYRSLLRARYIEGMTWERIAVDMDCSYQNVVQFLHPKALAAVGAALDSI